MPLFDDSPAGVRNGALERVEPTSGRAAVLWDGGILVNVPQPERYAVHKLIVAERRTASAIAKRRKDLHQASSLFDALAEHRAHDLAAAWNEAYGAARNGENIFSPLYRIWISSAATDSSMQSAKPDRSLPDSTLNFGRGRSTALRTPSKQICRAFRRP
jgi:hypothetical protein